MLDDKVYKDYKKKYGTEQAVEKMKLARDNMLTYGYKDTKEQFAIQKMADHIKDKSPGASMEQAIKQARNTKVFIDDLDSQGQKGIIGDPDKQTKYVEAIAKSKGYAKGSKEYANLESSYANAFKSAAVWQQVNRK